MSRKNLPGGFVFEPRSVVEKPGLFGKIGMPLAAESEVGARFQAAQLQHLVANAVRELLLLSGQSLKSFAESDMGPAMSYDRFARIQRGETMITLADLFALAEQFPELRARLAELVTNPPIVPPTAHSDAPPPAA